MINTFFSKFGLTKNEQEIYLYLLGSGTSIASMIAKRLGIKRVTTYAALETLHKKQLVTSFQRNNVTYFEAVSPEEIVNICKRKIAEDMDLENQAKTALKELKTLESRQSTPVLEVKGKIKYYQGLEAVRGLIDETLDEGKVEQLCFGLNKYHTEHLWDDWKNYTKKRAKVGMSVRSIQPDIKAAKEYKNRDKDELRETLLIPNKKFPAACELNVIGDMIAIFTSHGKEPTGMKLYNKDMAQVLKSLFELAWEKAKEYDKKLDK